MTPSPRPTQLGRLAVCMCVHVIYFDETMHGIANQSMRAMQTIIIAIKEIKTISNSLEIITKRERFKFVHCYWVVFEQFDGWNACARPWRSSVRSSGESISFVSQVNTGPSGWWFSRRWFWGCLGIFGTSSGGERTIPSLPTEFNPNRLPFRGFAITAFSIDCANNARPWLIVIQTGRKAWI